MVAKLLSLRAYLNLRAKTPWLEKLKNLIFLQSKENSLLTRAVIPKLKPN